MGASCKGPHKHLWASVMPALAWNLDRNPSRPCQKAIHRGWVFIYGAADRPSNVPWPGGWKDWFLNELFREAELGFLQLLDSWAEVCNCWQCGG